jgi:GT2 family glycosyltransferase
MAKVSVIIVNYNGQGLITACLRALEAQSFRDFEIIVVDNASLDDSLYEVQTFLKESPIAPLVKVIPLGRNSGFAGGNIEGLKYANGEYICLLNNDTEADKSWLEELAKVMDDHPAVGICASKMIVHGTDMIDSAADGYARILKGYKRGEGEGSEKFGQQEYVFGACAGAALYRRRMLNEIGFFDEDFFLIYEDTDLSFRAQLYGWKVLYVPAALVHHKVNSSIGRMSDMAIYYSLRNSELVRVKNVPFEVFIRCLPEFIIGMIVEFIYFAVKHRKLGLYVRSRIDAVRLLPKMIEKRRLIMKTRRVSNDYLLRMMTPIWSRNFLRTKLKKIIYG